MSSVPPGTAGAPARDLRDEAPADPALALDAVVSTISEISTLPTVALRIMEVASDPEAGAAELTAAIESDPALGARVLRCVNSAAFGLRTQIADLAQAVAYLGFNQIRDLAITATVSDIFRDTRRIHHYDRPGLWRHLVAAGVVARMVAQRIRVDGWENAFLSGLLHDIGIILFDQYRHDEFHRVMASLNTQRTLVEFERKFVPWDHAELGHRVGTVWKLPAPVLDAMRWHHEPGACPSQNARIVHCVAVANFLCSRRDITSVGLNLVGLAPGSLSALGLEKRELEILGEDLEAELDSNRHLFELQKG